MSVGCSCIVHKDIEARLRGGEYLRQCRHALSATIWKTRSRSAGAQRYLWTRCKPARPCDGRLQFSNASRLAQLTQRPMASDSVASLFVEAFGAFDVRNRKNGQLDLHIDLAPAFSPVSLRTNVAPSLPGNRVPASVQLGGVLDWWDQSGGHVAFPERSMTFAI
jgi:hypothetical protein